jgi:hypothetical protein
MATSGPGAIHLLNGLYDARADHQPVLAILDHALNACRIAAIGTLHRATLGYFDREHMDHDWPQTVLMSAR